MFYRPCLAIGFTVITLVACSSSTDEEQQPPLGDDSSEPIAPSVDFDLDHWKLTLPLDASGGKQGVAAEVIDLADYHKAPYFYDDGKGVMVFRAPADGATTENSESPRSELREMLDLSDSDVNWADTGQAILEASLRVDHVPSTGRIIVGQVHSNDSSPMVKLMYDYHNGVGKLIFQINETPDARSSTNVSTVDGIDLGEIFSYRIEVRDRVITVTLNGAAPVDHPINMAWTGIGHYFKAGAYVQAHNGDSSDYGQVSFFELVATHPQGELDIINN